MSHEHIQPNDYITHASILIATEELNRIERTLYLWNMIESLLQGFPLHNRQDTIYVNNIQRRSLPFVFSFYTHTFYNNLNLLTSITTPNFLNLSNFPLFYNPNNTPLSKQPSPQGWNLLYSCSIGCRKQKFILLVPTDGRTKTPFVNHCRSFCCHSLGNWVTL